MQGCAGELPAIRGASRPLDSTQTGARSPAASCQALWVDGRLGALRQSEAAPMRDKFAVVTGANSGYFYFAQGLISSIRDKKEGKATPICFLDFGCSKEELAWLANIDVCIKKANWDFEFQGRDTMPEYFKAMTARPHLPEYFTDFDILVWMDADSWLQDWAGLELYVAGAARKGFAVTPEVHASYAGCLDRSSALRRFIHDKYESAFGRATAELLQCNAVLNTGVCGMHRHSELRQVWIENLSIGLSHTQHYMVELLAMNLALYQNFEKFYPDHVDLLPPVCNWMCHQSLPVLEEETGLLRSPTPPHEVISVIHRTTDVLKRQAEVEIRTLAGGTIKSTLEYANGTYAKGKPAIPSWQQDSGWAVGD
jgi:hypothetical protein